MNVIRKLSVIAAALALSAVCFMPVCIFADDAETVSGPVTNDFGVTTWDCIFFGHYPQSSDGNGGFVDEPIKWRVLNVSGDDAFIMSDMNIDSMPYCAAENDPKYDCLWHVSSVRSWLNGYGADENKLKIDYSEDNFISKAFSDKELMAVKTTKVITDKYTDWHYSWSDPNHYYMETSDKVYLLEYNEALDPKYGFTFDDEPTVTRVARNTAFTAAGGSYHDLYRNGEGKSDSWLLRSPGEYSMYADIFTAEGEYKEDISDVNPVNVSQGIRPVIHLDLTETDLWSYAGKYTERFSQTVTVTSRYEKRFGDSAFDLNARATGDSVLVYSSSDGSVASVDEKGIVTITGAGTAVITVTAPMTDSFAEASKQVTVNVRKGERSMSCGDMTMLMTDAPRKASVDTEEGAKLSYSSSDPEVADVSEDGMVTPYKAGVTEITVKAESDNRYEAASTSFKVTVYKASSVIKAKKTSAKFKVKKLKKKAGTFSIGVSCTSGVKVTCKKKSGHKYLKISKTGKVTVKKGARKGTYKMKVLTSAAANTKYNAVSKTVTVKVIVKK